MMSDVPRSEGKEEQFGCRMFSLGYGFHGILSEDQAIGLARTIVERIGMTEVSGAIERFEGKAVGFTYIMFLFESFVAIDFWQEPIDGGYCFVNSCKDFEPSLVMDCLRESELAIQSSYDVELSL